MPHGDRFEDAVLAQWRRDAGVYCDPRQRKDDAAVGAAKQFTRGLNTLRTFRIKDRQRLVGGALAESPRGNKSGQTKHVIGMPVRECEDSRRKDAGAQRELQTFTGIDEELHGAMPEPRLLLFPSSDGGQHTFAGRIRKI